MRNRDTSDRFEKFCVVGLGGHARTKLIPAILANGQKVSAVVSGRAIVDLADTAVYPSIDAAIDSVSLGTAFIIASPPGAHFNQVRQILQRGFDVIVEKPAFVTGRDARQVVELADKHSALLIEGHMQRYSRIYARLIEDWAALAARVRRLRMAFLVPSMPQSTFRQNVDIASSGLLDIGCYPVALLADVGLEQADLRLEGVTNVGLPDRERYRIAGRFGAISIDADIGVGDLYENAVEIHLDGGEVRRYAPFFFGRAGQRVITRTCRGETSSESFADGNAFETMLRMPRDFWQRSQRERSAGIVAVASRLEALAIALAAARSSVPSR